MHCERLEHLTCSRFLLGRCHLANPASQSGPDTANLVTLSVCGLRTTAIRERRNCVQVAGSNLSLLEPTLCTSISYSSAMTVRRESVFCKSCTIGTFPDPHGFLWYDGVCNVLQLLYCMTYRLSIPTPPGEGYWVTSLLRQYSTPETGVQLCWPLQDQHWQWEWQWAPAVLYSYFCFAILSETCATVKVVSGRLQLSTRGWRLMNCRNRW